MNFLWRFTISCYFLVPVIAQLPFLSNDNSIELRVFRELISNSKQINHLNLLIIERQNRFIPSNWIQSSWNQFLDHLQHFRVCNKRKCNKIRIKNDCVWSFQASIYIEGFFFLFIIVIAPLFCARNDFIKSFIETSRKFY